MSCGGVHLCYNLLQDAVSQNLLTLLLENESFEGCLGGVSKNERVR